MPMKLAGKTVNIMSGKQLKIQVLPAGRDQTGNPECVTASMSYRLQHAESMKLHHYCQKRGT